MVTQYGIKLAVHIITTHFGNLVAKVCECLLVRGTLTLQSIIRYTELSRTQVRNSLLVLIQHNCVQAFALEQEGGFGEASKVHTQYMALFDHIIHRMRFPKFVETVSKEFDNQCVKIFEALLQHGRLTLLKLHDKARAEDASVVKDATRECLKRLIDTHFVERCPAAEPLLSLTTQEEPSRKRYAKTRGSEAVEVRALSAAAPIDSLRFSLLSNYEAVDEEKTPDMSAGISVGAKRKHSTLDLNKELESSQNDGEFLWRPNFEEFLRRLRHKACVANVRERLDEGAAMIVSAILEAIRNSESKVKTEGSAPLSLNNIFEEVMKIEAGRSMTLDHIRASLDQLGCHQSERETEELYSIDLQNIIELAKNKEVESTVLKRHGKDAYRIFRLLTQTSRFVETDKIADSTFVDKKETANILHKLWKDDYITMEKLLLHGPRQLQVILWKMNSQAFCARYLDDLYHAAINLCLRKAHQAAKDKEILTLPREVRVGVLKDKYNKAASMGILMESALMKLDDAIMLFHDF